MPSGEPSQSAWLVVGCWLLVVGCWLLVVGCWLVLAQDVITTVGQVSLLFVHCSVVRWVSYISLVYLDFVVSPYLYSPIYVLEW